MDANTWFAVNDPDCPLKSVELSIDNSPAFTPYKGLDVTLKTVSLQEMLTISTANLKNKTTLVVKGKTVSDLIGIQKFTYQICQAPKTNSSAFNYVINKNMGRQVVENATLLFTLKYACPIISYELYSKDDSNNYVAYTGTDITLKGDQIMTLTNKSFVKTLYVKINARFKTKAFTPFTLTICGTEAVTLIKPQFARVNYQFKEGDG